MIAGPAITGVILCGGEGKRFGGREKPFEIAGGIPLLAHVRHRLAPQVTEIIISANRRLGEYAAWGDPVIPDDEPGLGPLGGVLSALRATRTPLAFCCPGDAPLLPTTLVSRLAEAMDRDAADVAVPHDGERLQPLFLLVRTELRDDLKRFLGRGERAAHAWVEEQRFVTIDASADRTQFANVNTADDLARLEKELTLAGASR